MAIEALEERRALRADYMARLAGAFQHGELERIDRMLAVWCHEETPVLQPHQSVLYDSFMPGLRTTCWFDESSFTWVPELEKHFEQMRRGYYEAVKHRRLIYYNTNPQATSQQAAPNRRIPHFPEGWKEFPIAPPPRGSSKARTPE